MTDSHTNMIELGNSTGKIIPRESVLDVSPGMLFVCKSFWLASMLALKPPRRLHTARIDVKLRQDVADDARRRYMSSEIKKRKIDATGSRAQVSTATTWDSNH